MPRPLPLPEWMTQRTTGPGPIPRSGRLVQLDEVAAAVREDRDLDGPGGHRLLRKRDSLLLQALELRRDVAHLEGGDRDALREHRLLEGPRRRVRVRLQRELEIVRALGRRDGDPAVFPDGEVHL